jgi:anaerobic selenocysteine-containing dehydrogenase
MRRAAQGEVPALLLLGGSVSEELPDHENLVDPALRSAYVVVTASHLNDPDVAYADLVLPRLSWFEREAHFVSSERRVSRSTPSIVPKDGARQDQWLLSGIGAAIAGGDQFDFETSYDAMEELRSVTEGTPADLSGLPLSEDLTAVRGMQWPVPIEGTVSSRGTARRHMGQDGRGPGFPTESGKGIIIPREHPGLRKARNPEFPFTAILSLDPTTWWSGQMYNVSGGDVIRREDVEPGYVEMTLDDAAALGLEEDALALVISPVSSIILPVRYAPGGSVPGTVFLPWGGGHRTPSLVASFPLDRNGVPPWSVFDVRVEPAFEV